VETDRDLFGVWVEAAELVDLGSRNRSDGDGGLFPESRCILLDWIQGW
jgi:hypothetical protein